MWTRIGVCPDFKCGERLWHAGLSPDGRLCFVASCYEDDFIVWDIGQSKVMWRAESTGPACLEEMLDKQGYVVIKAKPARGKYRIFGLNTNYAKAVHEADDLALELCLTEETLFLRRHSTGETIESVRYEAFSGDWAFASFSDNGQVIAVIEPYFVTFFGK